MAEVTETPELAVAAQQNGHDGRRRSGGGRREAL
jgi:hypothetical protein